MLLARLGQPCASAVNRRHVHTTAPLCAAMMKARRRIDPEQMKMREERTRRKTNVRVRQLQRADKVLKPIDELVVSAKLKVTLPDRVRAPVQLSEEEQDRRALLQKAWSKHRNAIHMEEQRHIERRLAAQHQAMEKLKEMNPSLYTMATQLDMGLLDFEAHGPTRTPPIPKYYTPDGEYTETTKKWD